MIKNIETTESALTEWFSSLVLTFMNEQMGPRALFEQLGTRTTYQVAGDANV